MRSLWSNGHTLQTVSLSHVHAVSRGQVPVNELLHGQVAHAVSYLHAKRQQLPYRDALQEQEAAICVINVYRHKKCRYGTFNR